MKPVHIVLLVIVIIFVVFLIFILAFRKKLTKINYHQVAKLKMQINPEELINIIGGKYNIQTLYATSNHIHFTLISIDQIQISMLKRAKVKNYNIKNNNLILNLGNQSKFIAGEIKKIISL